MEISNSRLLIGTCGSINILNLHEYLIYFGGLTKSINVIMTKSATKMLQTNTIRAITGNSVFTDDNPGDLPVPHINLSCWADIFIILPATGNILGKVANGIADDLLTTTIMASNSKIFFVPGMNNVMWNKPSVIRNVKTLEEDGNYVLRCEKFRDAYEASSGKMVSTVLMPSPSEVINFIINKTELITV